MPKFAIGENNPSAKLTDAEVDMARDMHENDGYGIRRLSAMFEIGHSAMARILRYEVRTRPSAKRPQNLSARRPDIPLATAPPTPPRRF